MKLLELNRGLPVVILFLNCIEETNRQDANYFNSSFYELNLSNEEDEDDNEDSDIGRLLSSVMRNIHTHIPTQSTTRTFIFEYQDWKDKISFANVITKSQVQKYLPEILKKSTQIISVLLIALSSSVKPLPLLKKIDVPSWIEDQISEVIWGQQSTSASFSTSFISHQEKEIEKTLYHINEVIHTSQFILNQSVEISRTRIPQFPVHSFSTDSCIVYDCLFENCVDLIDSNYVEIGWYDDFQNFNELIKLLEKIKFTDSDEFKNIQRNHHWKKNIQNSINFRIADLKHSIECKSYIQTIFI